MTFNEMMEKYNNDEIGGEELYQFLSTGGYFDAPRRKVSGQLHHGQHGYLTFWYPYFMIQVSEEFDHFGNLAGGFATPWAELDARSRSKILSGD